MLAHLINRPGWLQLVFHLGTETNRRIVVTYKADIEDDFFPPSAKNHFEIGALA